MSKNLVRLSQVPMGATFKYFGALYKKIHQTRKSGVGKHQGRDYEPNVLRLDNGKTFKLHGSVPVEIIYDNETKN